MEFQVEPVSKEKFGFGEAPIWDDRRKKLIFVDCFDKSAVMFDPKTKEFNQKRIPNLDRAEYIIVAMPCTNSDPGDTSENSDFLIGAMNKLYRYNWNSDKCEMLFELKAEGNGNTKYNLSDGKCDSKGRFWTGSYTPIDIGELGIEPNSGKVHRLDYVNNQLKESTHGRNYDIPNGLAWNKENNKLFYADLLQRVVNVYDFNEEDGTLENPQVFFDFRKEGQKGYPDGMVTDKSGNLWVACWKGASVIKIDQHTGKLVETVKIPVDNTTSVCFGGDNYESLFVTTTSRELNKSSVEGQPECGKLFCVRAPRDNSFKGIQHYYAKI